MSEYELISLISLLRQEAAGFQWKFFLSGRPIC